MVCISFQLPYFDTLWFIQTLLFCSSWSTCPIFLQFAGLQNGDKMVQDKNDRFSATVRERLCTWNLNDNVRALCRIFSWKRDNKNGLAIAWARHRFGLMSFWGYCSITMSWCYRSCKQQGVSSEFAVVVVVRKPMEAIRSESSMWLKYSLKLFVNPALMRCVECSINPEDWICVFSVCRASLCIFGWEYISF